MIYDIQTDQLGWLDPIQKDISGEINLHRVYKIWNGEDWKPINEFIDTYYDVSITGDTTRTIVADVDNDDEEEFIVVESVSKQHVRSHHKEYCSYYVKE